MNEPEYDPDAGGVGYLTFDQWDRLTRAWQTAFKHLPWWWVAGHVRGGDADELRSRNREHTLPLPATWLAAHEITRLMQELNQWRHLEDAANDVDGAEFALLLVREVETAAAKWPLSDRSHRVQHFRCQACQQQTLKYLPPNLRGPADAPRVTVQARFTAGPVREDAVEIERLVLVQGKTVSGIEELPATVEQLSMADVVVRCTNKQCGAVMDHSMFEIAVSVIQQEWELRNAKRRVDSDSGSPSESGPESAHGVSVDSGGPDSHDEASADSLAVPA